MFYPWPVLLLIVAGILIWIGATDRVQGVHDALFTFQPQSKREPGARREPEQG